MNEKCNWKDEKFEPCENRCQSLFHMYQGIALAKFGIVSLVISYCPFCGADIRKPEPAEPMSVKNEEKTCTGAILGQCEYIYIKGNGFGCNYNYICAFQRPQKSADIPPEAV